MCAQENHIRTTGEKNTLRENETNNYWNTTTSRIYVSVYNTYVYITPIVEKKFKSVKR